MKIQSLAHCTGYPWHFFLILTLMTALVTFWFAANLYLTNFHLQFFSNYEMTEKIQGNKRKYVLTSTWQLTVFFNKYKFILTRRSTVLCWPLFDEKIDLKMEINIDPSPSFSIQRAEHTHIIKSNFLFLFFIYLFFFFIFLELYIRIVSTLTFTF